MAGMMRKKKQSDKIIRPYPRVPLEKALAVPYALKDKNGGNPWAPAELAAAVGLSVKTNDFFYMAAASRAFGFTLGGSDSKEISLTDLGRELVYAGDAETEKRLKMQAFLGIDIFKMVLDYYKGNDLPEMKYLGNTLTKQFNLDSSTHDEFSDLFAQNCKYLNIGTGFSRETSDAPPVTKADERGRTASQLSVVTLAETKDADAPSCFVVMPFKERDKLHSEGFFEEVLKSLIVPAGAKAGFRVDTANRSGSDVIQATIVNNLLDADLIIADLTEHNPNVLFELGVRMADDKPVALIRAKGTTPIFDVDNMLRVFEYDPNLWSSTIKADLPELIKHIEETWKQRDSRQTYMKILRGKK